MNQDPWQIIRKSGNSSKSHDLRLIVHGSSGGVIQPILIKLVEQLRSLRDSSVELEVITDNKFKCSNSSSILLVPLLLLPGEHVRNDIPKIRARLRSQGVKTKLIPFLGAWPHWISIIKYYIQLESRVCSPILLHHPIKQGIGSNYLNYLNQKLNIPIISWTKWHKSEFKLNKNFSPIPYSLAPNQNTKSLKRNDLISSLMEIEIIFSYLIKLLVLLP